MRGLSRALLVTAVIGAVTGSVWALPWTPNVENQLGGNGVVATDQNYVNTAGVTYLMPANIFNAVLNPVPVAPVLGSVAGQQESIRPGYLAGGGINLPQPAVLAAASGDIRAGVPNFLPSAYQGLPSWGVRTGALAAWESIKDGITQPLLPSGRVTSSFYNATPLAPLALSASLFDDGLAPLSVAGDGVMDFIPWAPDPAKPGAVQATYVIKFLDIPTALGLGYDLATAQLLAPRIDLYEDVPAGTILDTSGRGRAYPSAGPLDQDLDGKVLTENDFNHNTGRSIGGSGTSEVSDATDTVPLLMGYARDIAATLTFRQASPTADVILELTISGAIDYYGGSMLHWLGPNTVGTFGASISGIVWRNLQGAGQDNGRDPASIAFDFAGYGSASANQSFTTIPEPLSVISSILAMGALGGYVRRRRTA